MSTTNMSSSQITGTADVASTTATATHPGQNTLGRLSASTLSMRNKKQMKRQANAQHNSNFHAGYVPVTEEVLHRSGIRGRKRYFLYCTIAVLISVAFVNTLVTANLLYLLRMTHQGVENFEMLNVSAKSFVHFFGAVMASSFLLNGVPLGSQHGADLKVTARNSSINISSFQASALSPNLTLNEGTVSIVADQVRVSNDGGQNWTSLDIQTVAKLHGISNYFVDSLTTKKIKNFQPVKDVYLESPVRMVEIFGQDGVDISSSKDLDITARDIVFQSGNSSVIFQSKRSVYLDPNLPSAPAPRARSSATSLTKKICVCGNGRLFFVRSDSCNVGKDVAVAVCQQ